MSIKLKVKYIADPHIHYAQEALIPPLEFTLVKYLNCNDRGFLDSSASKSDNLKIAVTSIPLTCRNSRSSTDSRSS